MSSARPDEVTPIDVSAAPSLFWAMVYLSALAYPDDTKKRDRFIDAMKSFCARNYNAAGRGHISPPLKRQQQDGQMRLGFARVHYRLRMAGAFAGIYSREVSAQLMPRSGLRFSGGGSLTGNLEKLAGKQDRCPDRREVFRNWTATAPVLHLAMSLRAHLLASRRIARSKSPTWLLAEPEWVLTALKNAEGHAMTLRQLRRWKSWQVRLPICC